ncbi:hypothetical protein ACIOBL_12265 [Paenibacillus taichungensis]|uniref:lipase/acyltransferase domain-containing protein n=1 Tax=Paenibacillus taichungensis TaxID=484184 RepID=UPI00382C9B6F
MAFCVFIPGIQGSKLHQGNNHRFPVYSREGMAHLELGQDDVPMDTSELYSILKHDVYETIDTYFNSQFGEENFKHFSYDWRFDLNQHFESLYTILHNKSDVVIVAHSMGGLLLKLFIHWCSDEGKAIDIKKIYTLGTPWQGSPESIYMLKYGSGFPKWFFKKIPSFIGLATADVMRKVSSSFPSVFQLLPHDHYIDHINPVLYNSDKTSLSSKDTFGKLLDKQQYNYYLNYSQSIQSIIASEWPSDLGNIHTAIVGHKLSTLGSIVLEQSAGGGLVNKKKLQWVSGDKTVPVTSGDPLFKCKKIFVKRDHLGVVQDRNILDFIAVDCGVDTDSETAYNQNKFENNASHTYAGRQYRIACPVSVSISNNGALLAGEVDSFETIEELCNVREPAQANTYRIDDSFFIFIDDDNAIEDSEDFEQPKLDKDYELEITSYDEGLATIEIDRYDEGKLKESKIFNGLELTEQTKAFLTFGDHEDIKTAQLFQDQGGEEKTEVEGYTLTPSEIEVINYPKTTWEITNAPVGEEEKVTLYNSKQISIVIENVLNVEEKDILEYRYLLNGQLFHENDNSFEIEPSEGKNTLTVFTMAKNGLTDKRPKTLTFEMGDFKLITNRQVILSPKEITIRFNANTGKREDIYKITEVMDQEGEIVAKQVFRTEYTPKLEKINFVTTDKFKNRGIEESIILPSMNVRDAVFNEASTVKQIGSALGIENIEKWEFKVNGRSVKNPETKITSRTRKVELSLDEVVYIIVFEEDFELFWEKGSEIISSNTEELEFLFMIKNASNRSNVHINELNSIIVKVFSKEHIELSINMDVDFDEKSDLFSTKLVISQLPNNVDKGYLKIFVNERPVREINFLFE